MFETHQLNDGPVCRLEVPTRYLGRRNLEKAYRAGFARGLHPESDIDRPLEPLGNRYRTAGMWNAWRAGFDDVRRQMAEALK